MKITRKALGRICVAFDVAYYLWHGAVLGVGASLWQEHGVWHGTAYVVGNFGFWHTLNWALVRYGHVDRWATKLSKHVEDDR